MERSVIRRKINILLLGIPIVLFHSQLYALAGPQLLALFGEQRQLAETLIVFALAALSLIPLAGFVESAVEELAELLGPFIGGLLHTTFGNIAELTIGLSVLLSFAGSGGSEIVLGSIAGVLIRNSLLFLGLSTLLGCWRNGPMKFSAENASEYSTVFALAVIGLSLPTIGSLLFSGGNTELTDFELHRLTLLSTFLAVVLLVSYLAYIGFAVFRLREGYNLVEVGKQRRTARLRQKLLKRMQRQQRSLDLAFAGQPDTQALFHEEREQAERRLEPESPTAQIESATAQALPGTQDAPRRIYARAAVLEERRKQRAERGEEGFLAGHRVWRGVVAVIVLAIATAGVASMSESFAKSVEYIFSTNEALRQQYEFFLGVILIPVLAGIVEFYGSLDAARRNRMEITMAVTAGASIQMILLVVPILVLVGVLTGHPLALVFRPLNIIIFGASTFVYMLLSRDGESTWLEGAQLITLWLLVAATALFVTAG